MESEDYRNAPNPASYIMADLGIDVNNTTSTFDPANQPVEIGVSFNQTNRNNCNKYAEEPEPEKKHNAFGETNKKLENDIDFEIPTKLNMESKVIKNPFNKTPKPEIKHNSNQEVVATQENGIARRKKDNRKLRKNTKNDKDTNKLQEIEINMDLDEVAEWGYKGTGVGEHSDSEEEEDDEDSFEKGGEAVHKIENNEEQDRIREKLEEKLKKYENQNGGVTQKNTLTSLKYKAEQLKLNNENTHNITPIHDESTNQIFDKAVNQQEKVMEEESEDPWEKVNADTLAKKQEEHEIIKKVESMDLNVYYQNLDLGHDIDSGDEENEEGFWEALCGCLKPQKSKRTNIENQLIKLSKVQLTNKPEEIQLLKEIWIELTGKKYLRFGEHWNDIGFQGRDPATDLRSTGILCLLQWRNFIKCHKNYSLKIFNFCEEYDIPLALTHIKVTSLVCSSIQKRQLEGKKWDDFQNWYNALTYYTFEYLIENGKNLDQIGEFVERAVERTQSNIQNSRSAYNKEFKTNNV